MDKRAAARIASASAKHPDSDSNSTGFYRRAQSAADKREHEEMDEQ
ncbi:hypothetical protein OIE66_33520 [Nonomuraea sp. NBC_01738]|nr:hypothetical protein OIE66_33520 [Nonomuraea sp. NBC_01738]